MLKMKLKKEEEGEWHKKRGGISNNLSISNISMKD
jgi:hypothetical protein